MALDKQIIQDFLKSSSFIGLLTLYFIKLKFDKKLAFSKDDFRRIRDSEYPYGYFVACSAIGLFDYTINDSIINVTVFDANLSLDLHAILVERANEHDKDPNVSPKWIDDIKRIENI